jgi:hypothetical protein
VTLVMSTWWKLLLTLLLPALMKLTKLHLLAELDSDSILVVVIVQPLGQAVLAGIRLLV